MRRRISFVVVLLALVACTQSPSALSTPDVAIPPSALNGDVRVYTPEGWNTFRVNDPIGLAIEVAGAEEIAFPADYGVRMFLAGQERWREVPNVPGETGAGWILSPSSGDPLRFGATTVFPVVEDVEGPVLLRIYVIGHYL